MKKIILSILLTITFVLDSSSQITFTCEEICTARHDVALKLQRTFMLICERQCEAEDNGWLDWFEQLECMIRGDCEEQDTNPAFLAFCKETCQLRFMDEAAQLDAEYYQCLDNCI